MESVAFDDGEPIVYYTSSFMLGLDLEPPALSALKQQSSRSSSKSSSSSDDESESIKPELAGLDFIDLSETIARVSQTVTSADGFVSASEYGIVGNVSFVQSANSFPEEKTPGGRRYYLPPDLSIKCFNCGEGGHRMRIREEKDLQSVWEAWAFGSGVS